MMKRLSTYFFITLSIFTSYGCNATLGEVTADNYYEILERADYSDQASLNQLNAFAECFTDEILKLNPTQFTPIEDVGKSYFANGSWHYNGEGLYELRGDKVEQTIFGNSRTISIKNKKNGDNYTYMCKESDASMLYRFQIMYNAYDPNVRQKQRFKESLDCAFMEHSITYKESRLKHGDDIMISDAGDYFLIGQIAKAKAEGTSELLPFIVNFDIYKKQKKFTWNKE